MPTKLPALYIGLRYLLSRQDNRFISFTSLMSMAGLTLGVLALIVVLSVFNGSQSVQRDKVLITVPHADIWAEPAMPDWEQAAALLGTQPGITGVAPYTLTDALLSQQGYHQVTRVRGIDPAREALVSPLAQHMREGSLDSLQPGSRNIVLGYFLAANLRLFPGDVVSLIVPRPNASGNGVSLDIQPFTVSGIFDVQYDIGAELAYVNLGDSLALQQADVPGQALHLRLATDDIDRAAEYLVSSLDLLEQQLPGPRYEGQDWSTAEAALFNALKLEKIMTTLMLMMIVAIGAFNIVSTLVMIVAEKQADIAILRTMGAGQGTILGIFLVQGSMIGVLGIIAGAVSGVVIAINFTPIAIWLENAIDPQGLYLISQLPAVLQRGDVIMICTSALLISFLATLYPAWKASRILPAQVLRYE
jgi:lipoprotein-releasing system permease protein